MVLSTNLWCQSNNFMMPSFDRLQLELRQPLYFAFAYISWYVLHLKSWHWLFSSDHLTLWFCRLIPNPSSHDKKVRSWPYCIIGRNFCLINFWGHSLIHGIIPLVCSWSNPTVVIIIVWFSKVLILVISLPEPIYPTIKTKKIIP